MDIFKEFDAILSALKPSQYRSLWQLYNYDKSKEERYKKEYAKNSEYLFGLPGEQSNILTESLCERILYKLDNAQPLMRSESILRKLYRYTDIINRLLAATEVCLSKAIDSAKFLEKFGFNKLAKDSISQELLDVYNKMMNNDKIVDDEYLKHMNFDEAIKYLPEEQAERIIYLMDEYKDRVIAEFKKHIGDTIPLDRYWCKDLHEKDGVYYWNNNQETPSGMDGDTLVWRNAKSGSNPATTMRIKANPLVRTLYDSLFPNGKYRIYLQTTADMTQDYMYLAHLNNLRPYAINVIDGICSLAKRYLKEKKHFDLVNYDKNKVSMRRFFIDGLFDYERDDKTISIRIGKILEAYRDIKESLSASEKEAIVQYHLIKQPRHFSGYIVISRHPYDLAGMSTGRGWTSCMHLETGGYNRYVPQSIAAGGLIAYLCDKDDKNIKNPKGRVLIKPYTKKHESMNYKEPNFKLFCSKVYGTFYNSCIQELQDWLDDNWNIKIDPEHKQPAMGKDPYSKLSEQFYNETGDDRM